MALYGALEAFPLPDLLRLLAATSKEGRLHVEGDRGHGWLWLFDGMVTAGSTDWGHDEASPTEVLFELLRLRAGAFVFETDQPTPGGGPPHDVEVMLKDAERLLREWEQLEAVVPSLAHRVRLVDALSEDKVTIHARHWPSMMAIGSGLTVNELVTKLNLSELDVTRIVHDLVGLGVVIVEAPGEGRDRGRGSGNGSTLPAGSYRQPSPPGIVSA